MDPLHLLMLFVGIVFLLAGGLVLTMHFVFWIQRRAMRKFFRTFTDYERKDL